MKKLHQLPPEIQVAYHSPSSKEKIETSHDAYIAFLKRWNPDTITMFEEFKVIYLNNDLNILGYRTIGKGGITTVTVDLRIILAIALKCNASSLICAHNHPSGVLRPSRQDIALTTKLETACNYHSIRLFEHLILTRTNYFSFADEGLLST